jgi:DNA-binding protein
MAIEEEASVPEPEEITEDNTVFVGKKPAMNYVLAAVTQFNSGSPEIIIKARGKAISRAVDVAEILKRRFITTAQVKDIKIGTETIKTSDGATISVSSIEIFMRK